MLPSILRLDTPAARPLRAHALAGDDLAVAQGQALLWLRPEGSDVAEARSGRKRLTLTYRAEEGETLALHFGVGAPDAIEAVLAAGRHLSVAAMDRCWRPTLSCVGRIPEPAARPQNIVTRLNGPVVVAARRAVHPSYLVDRLMMRQRAIVCAMLEERLRGGADIDARRIA